MIYRVEIKDKNDVWQDVDIFTANSLQFSSSIADSINPSDIKTPFSFPTRLPYNLNNRTIFDYDILTDMTSNMRIAYDTKMYDSGDNLMLEGVATLRSVVTNVAEPYFDFMFEDRASKFMKELNDIKYYEIFSGETDFETYDNLSDRLGAGYTNDNVHFPYINLCNDNDADVAKRQYIQHGTNGDATGFLPAVKYKYIVERCFDKLGYNVRSKLFNIGTTSDGTINTDDLYLVHGFGMQGDGATRVISLTPKKSVLQINDDTINQSSNASNQSSIYQDTGYGTKQTPPTNFSTTKLIVTPESRVGYEELYPTAYQANWDDTSVGYIGAKASFDAELIHNGNINHVIPEAYKTSDFSLEIPMFYEENASGESVPFFVREINPLASSAKIKIVTAIYENGSLVCEAPLYGENGRVIELNVSDATISAGSDQHKSGGALVVDEWLTTADVQNDFKMTWDGFKMYPKVHEVDFKFKAGNQYQTRLEYRMVSGTINADVFTIEVAGLIAKALPASEKTIDVYQAAKAKIAFQDDADMAKLKVTIRSKGWATETNWDIANMDDDFKLITGFKKFGEISAANILRDLMKRFRIQLYWDVNNDRFVFDTASELKGYIADTSESISDSIDTLKAISVDLNVNVPNEISIKNKDYDDFFDKDLSDLLTPFGSYEGKARLSLTDVPNSTYNESKLSYKFDTALINKSICGDKTGAYIEDDGDMGSEGIVYNEFGTLDKVGLRVTYLSNVSLPTNIYQHAWNPVLKELIYKHAAITFMDAAVVNQIGSNDLAIRSYDADDETIPYGFYDYFTSQEDVMYNFLPKLNVDIVKPTDFIKDVEFRDRNYSIDSNTDASLAVMSLDGNIHKTNFNGKIKALAINKTTMFEPSLKQLLDITTAAAGNMPSIQSAIIANNLLRTLSNAGVLEYARWIYLFLTDADVSFALRNVINPTAYTGQIVQPLTFTENYGITSFNGTGYVNTGFTPSTDSTEGDTPSAISFGFGTHEDYDGYGGCGVWGQAGVNKGVTDIVMNKDIGNGIYRTQMNLNNDTSNFKDGAQTVHSGNIHASRLVSNEVRAFSDMNIVDTLPQNGHKLPDGEFTLFGVNDYTTGTTVLKNGMRSTMTYAYYIEESIWGTGNAKLQTLYDAFRLYESAYGY